MAYTYKKKYAPKRTNYKRKTYNNRRKPMARKGTNYMSYAKMAVQAFKMGKYALGALNVEYKNTSSATTWSNVINVPDNQPMIQPITQGTAEQERIGSCIELKSSFLSGLVTRNAAATSPATRVKIVIWQPLDNNYANNQGDFIGKVYENTDINALRNINYTNRYVVHLVKSYTLTSQSPARDFKIMWKYPANYKYQYNNLVTTGNPGDLEKNCMYISVISDEPTYGATIDWNIRTTFIDN